LRLQLRQPPKRLQLRLARGTTIKAAFQHSPSCPKLPTWSVANAGDPTMDLGYALIPS